MLSLFEIFWVNTFVHIILTAMHNKFTLFFSQLISLMKSLHLLVEKHKYQYLILASLILAACYRYIVCGKTYIQCKSLNKTKLKRFYGIILIFCAYNRLLYTKLGLFTRIEIFKFIEHV
jgi:hypothetical protein